MKRFGVSRQSVALTAVSAVCVALLLPHGASSAVSRQSGDIQLVGKTKYLNNAHSAVTHTVDDSTKHVVAVIDALDKYGVKGTLFISTEQDPPVEERFFTQLQVWKLWPRLEKAIEDGHELGSHARTHPCRRPDTAEWCGSAYSEDEVVASRDDILRRTKQPYVWSWCYPCGHCANHDFIRARIAAAGYIVARNYPDEPNNGHLAPDLRTWAPDFYNAAYTQVVQKRGGSATSQVIDVDVLNEKFDEVHAEGGIYHFLSHPQWLDFGPEGFYERHLAHIARRNDVWYVPMGPTIDIGSAFRPDLQDPTLAPSAVAGASSLAAQNPNQIRGYRGYGNITYRQYDGWRTFHSTELAMNRRFQNGLQFGFSDTIVISDLLGVDPRYDHGPDGQVVLRADQADAQELLGNQNTPRHNMRATFVWQLPQIPSPDNQVLKVLRLIANDWQLSGVWTGTSGSSYTVTQQYQTGNANVNLTGSPDFAPRIRIVGDTGDGCSSDPYRQFNTAAFQGPLVGSVGLESGNGYLFGCFQSALDLSIARNIRLGGNRTLQFRVDMFNAPNQARPVSRNTQLQLSSPADPVTPLNLPFDANGNVLPNRVRPNQAGFGAVQTWQAPRTIQAYIRFGF